MKIGEGEEHRAEGIEHRAANNTPYDPSVYSVLSRHIALGKAGSTLRSDVRNLYVFSSHNIYFC